MKKKLTKFIQERSSDEKESQSSGNFFSGKTDMEIWKAFKAGNKDAFNFIYQSNVQQLYVFGQQITRDKELIKDCITT